MLVLRMFTWKCSYMNTYVIKLFLKKYNSLRFEQLNMLPVYRLLAKKRQTTIAILKLLIFVTGYIFGTKVL